MNIHREDCLGFLDRFSRWRGRKRAMFQDLSRFGVVLNNVLLVALKTQAVSCFNQASSTGREFVSELRIYPLLYGKPRSLFTKAPSLKFR